MRNLRLSFCEVGKSRRAQSFLTVQNVYRRNNRAGGGARDYTNVATLISAFRTFRGEDQRLCSCGRPVRTVLGLMGFRRLAALPLVPFQKQTKRRSAVADLGFFFSRQLR